jgi:hypothetical protein
MVHNYTRRSLGSSVGIVTVYGLGDPGLIPGIARFFSSPQAHRPDWLTQPPIQWVPGIISPGANRKELEAVPSPQSSAEVKNGGTIPTPPPPICLHGIVLN